MRISIAIRFLKKSLTMSIIVMIQLAVTIILVNLLVGKYNALTDVLNMCKGFDGERTYMYMPAASLFESNTRKDKLTSIINKYSSELSLEQVINDIRFSDDGIAYEINALGNKTSITVRNTIAKGKWYTEVDCENIPCVTYSDHELGDIISLTIDDRKLEFQVVGIISRNANVFKFNTASNKPILEYLFDDNDNYSSPPILIFNQTDVPFAFDTLADANGLIYFHSNDEVIINQIVGELQEIAWVEQLDLARLKSQSQLTIHINTLAPIIVSIFLVGLISTLCLTVLNALRHMRLIAIYYICGMNWASHVFTCLIYMGFQIVGVFALLAVFNFVNNKVGIIPTNSVIVNSTNAVSTAIILVLALLIFTITQIIINKEETPIEYIKERL